MATTGIQSISSLKEVSYKQLQNVPGELTDMSPDSAAPFTLPNFPFFSKLLRYAYRQPCALAVRDDVSGIERSYLHLLTDVLSLCNSLRRTLSAQVHQQLDNQEEVYICILAPGGYEFVVGFIAILALGAAAVPLSTSLPVQEGSYYVRKSRAVAMLSSSNSSDLAEHLQQFLRASSDVKGGSLDILNLNIAQYLCSEPCLPSEILLSSSESLDPNGAGTIIFTSGTTGPPKAAVQRRNYATDVAETLADDLGVNDRDTILHVFPVHHTTGVGTNILPFLIKGACVEFRSGGFDPAWVWRRWRDGGLTFFSGVPTMYQRLMRHYKENIAELPPAERKTYELGARQIRSFLCGTSALPQPLQEFWTTIRGGQPINTRYGSTETQLVFTTGIDARGIPVGSVGPARPGIEVKLVNGDEGEILVKSPWMFAKYLDDDTATAEIFDKDGFFRTGDIGRREGPNYFILGRASIDIIKSGGYKISALDIEREIGALPYISEVMVVGVPDEEYGQRVAAAVSLLKPDRGAPIRTSPTITELRQDLRSQLSSYKMPTLLRVVRELPTTASGKVMKKQLGPELFPNAGHPEVQKWTKRTASPKL
ncbi:hypothetical protein VF21_10004 [Pseudogymnoascus sp. 05NY08]|nr:hypothetical protein VF21_10004 [Pseudogymnoascus sp. 05NY08]